MTEEDERGPTTSFIDGDCMRQSTAVIISRTAAENLDVVEEGQAFAAW